MSSFYSSLKSLKVAERNEMRTEGKICLLNPGPVTLTRRVRQALLRPELCHREPEFAALQTEVRERLARVYPEAASNYTVVLLTGSGTAAVEAMLGSLVPRRGKALVVENGVYGERVSSILTAQGKEFDRVRSAWTEPMNLDEVKRKLSVDSRVSHIIAVHHETTTGRLNDVAALGELCRQHGAALLLDTVSSFGGERIDLENWNVEACASTANKCLHSVPGIAFVLVKKSALEDRPSAACSIYLDLHSNYQEQRKGYPQFTPSVQALYALHEALLELEEMGGWRQRQAHYQALSQLVREGMRQCGVSLLLRDPACYSAILSSFLLPQRVVFQELYERLKQAGYVIYPGQAALKEAIFRVAVLGDLSPQDMMGFLEAFSAACGLAAAPRGDEV
jgi:2-aminoethylphosphonate-pyruvate transaminase